jgi:broad specificity phosphatase PhoE
MESLTKRCLLIFVRHGERLDQVKTKPPGSKIDFAFDPQMTTNGLDQAAKVARLTRAYM